MAKIDLLSLTEDNLIGGIQQKKIMIYGSNDCGKTFQATKFEKPLLLMTESGGGALKVKKLPINKWSEFKTVVEELTNPKTFDKMFDVYKTIVIDTLNVCPCFVSSCISAAQPSKYPLSSSDNFSSTSEFSTAISGIEVISLIIEEK